jgi:hypothetical protein
LKGIFLIVFYFFHCFGGCLKKLNAHFKGCSGFLNTSHFLFYFSTIACRVSREKNGRGEDFSGAGLLPYTKWMCEVCDDLGSVDGGTTHNPRFWQCFCNLVGMGI